MFIDKPIIVYSIEAAIRSGIFCEVMVSTDSREIADTAVKYGVKSPFLRSDKCSNDYAITNDVLYEVLDNYKDMVPIYHDCGQFYFYRLVDGKFLDGEYTPIIVPELEVQDIDTYEDWKLAGIKYELMMEE